MVCHNCNSVYTLRRMNAGMTGLGDKPEWLLFIERNGQTTGAYKSKVGLIDSGRLARVAATYSQVRTHSSDRFPTDTMVPGARIAGANA